MKFFGMATNIAAIFLVVCASVAGGIGQFDCSGSGGLPIQVYADPDDGAAGPYDVSALDVTTGVYNILYTFPLDKVGEAKSINSVGVSPTDGIAYGTAKSRHDDSTYIIRFDSSSMEWLQKMPNGMFVSGAFTKNGDFIVTAKRKKIMYRWTSADISALTGYADYMQVPDSTASIITTTESMNGNDLVIFEAKIESAATEEE